MCGISGLIVSTHSGSSLEECGKRMMNALVHRGPDSHGMWVNKKDGIALVHNRLAIQDLSEFGNQPMRSKSGRYCIAFNGEIYNFRELASELSSKGHYFSGHSDTEVLLGSIEEWGLSEAVKRSTGMFAFSLWDEKERTISLCRDRMGEKPLYYGWINNCFCFSSELKAIEAITPKDKLALDQGALADYFRHGYISAPRSIYQGIYKLIPGTILTCPIRTIFKLSGYSPYADSSLPGPKTYWSVIDAANKGLSNLITNHNEAIEELEATLHKTIRHQKVADVKVGVFLSGGIDSSTIAAIAQAESMDRIRTFSIGFNETEYDESIYAEGIARHLGTDHSTLQVSSHDTLQIVPDLPLIYDEPFSDSSQIPMYILSRFARRKVTVCLSGDGGDELFAGYNRYLTTNSIWHKGNAIPFFFRNLIGKILAIPSPCFWDNIYNCSGVIRGKNHQEMQKQVGLKIQKLACVMQISELMQAYNYLLSYWDQPQEVLKFAPTDILDGPVKAYPSTNQFINKAMFLDQIDYLPGDNLNKVDRASMAVSLETRLPLLNHELVELSWRIPASMKVHNATPKWILREVLLKHVPKRLIERPKMGFSVPIAQWLREDLRSWAEDMLGLLGTNGYEFICERTVRSVWNAHLSGKRDYSHKLWTVLMLLSWMHQRR